MRLRELGAVSSMRYSVFTFAPDRWNMMLAEQYLVCESSMARSTAAGSMFSPLTMKVMVTSVKTLGALSAWTPLMRVSMLCTFWRFFSKMLITSMLVQPATPASRNSMGVAPCSSAGECIV